MAYEFRCADAGASSCRWRTTADNQEELLQKVGDHLRKKHKVTQVTKSLQNYALKAARER